MVSKNGIHGLRYQLVGKGNTDPWRTFRLIKIYNRAVLSFNPCPRIVIDIVFQIVHSTRKYGNMDRYDYSFRWTKMNSISNQDYTSKLVSHWQGLFIKAKNNLVTASRGNLCHNKSEHCPVVKATESENLVCKVVYTGFAKLTKKTCVWLELRGGLSSRATGHCPRAHTVIRKF